MASRIGVDLDILLEDIEDGIFPAIKSRESIFINLEDTPKLPLKSKLIAKITQDLANKLEKLEEETSYFVLSKIKTLPIDYLSGEYSELASNLDNLTSQANYYGISLSETSRINKISGFLKKFRYILTSHKDYSEFSTSNAKVVTYEFPDPNNKYELRNWWHKILLFQGKYNCYGIILTLPADKEATRYLLEYGDELEIVSGKNCLIIALSESLIRRSGFDKENWDFSLDKKVYEGHSTKIAKLFNIQSTEFPCLILFNDIRTTKFAMVSLKAMSAEEISQKIRLVFSVVDKAIENKNDVLKTLQANFTDNSKNKTDNVLIDYVRDFAGKTLEVVMETWIKTIIK